MTIARQIITCVASGLHANGQQTEETEKSVASLALVLGTPTEIVVRWDELQLAFEPSPNTVVAVLKLAAANIGINRVVAIDRVVEELSNGSASPSEAIPMLHRAISLGALPTHLFAFACAIGAAALAVTLGALHIFSLGVIFVSAGIGGYVRRHLGGWGANNFAQTFVAALLAGVIGSAGVRLGISSDLRLVAVCPCMVLVPGPHLLNGTLDLLEYRIPLGMSRVGFALITLAAISAGLLMGMAAGHITLPPAPAARETSFCLTVFAAGVAAACFGVFFSLPLRFLFWPFSAGMIAGAIRWTAVSISGVDAAIGAAMASFVVGLLLLPVAHRFRVPLAGVGFASIVSLMPGVLVFRAVSGLTSLANADDAAVPQIIKAVANNGVTAVCVVFALSVGIVIPKHVFDIVMRNISGGTRA